MNLIKSKCFDAINILEDETKPDVDCEEVIAILREIIDLNERPELAGNTMSLDELSDYLLDEKNTSLYVVVEDTLGNAYYPIEDINTQEGFIICGEEIDIPEKEPA